MDANWMSRFLNIIVHFFSPSTQIVMLVLMNVYPDSEEHGV